MIALEGEFIEPFSDFEAAVRSLVDEVIGASEEEVRVELSAVSRLTPDGIGVLLGLQRFLESTGRSLRLVHPSPQAREALERTGAHTRLPWVA